MMLGVIFLWRHSLSLDFCEIEEDKK